MHQEKRSSNLTGKTEFNKIIKFYKITSILKTGTCGLSGLVRWNELFLGWTIFEQLEPAVGPLNRMDGLVSYEPLNYFLIENMLGFSVNWPKSSSLKSWAFSFSWPKSPPTVAQGSTHHANYLFIKWAEYLYHIYGLWFFDLNHVLVVDKMNTTIMLHNRFDKILWKIFIYPLFQFLSYKSFKQI